MRYSKQVLHTLEKCYALSYYTAGEDIRLLVAAEKQDPCYGFDLEGKLTDTVWEGPGGVMTMVPVPGQDGAFLATQRFYSPNNSASASLACAVKTPAGWRVTETAPLPFVHRFDIFTVEGEAYVLACTLKSGHEYENDWRFPGKLLTAKLGNDPTQPLNFTTLLEGLGHNHGYTRGFHEGKVCGIVSCDKGVFRVTPEENWKIEQLTDAPASDAVCLDLDGDGEEELFTISPFHGDTVTIRHRIAGEYVPVWEYPEKLPFLHAICGGTIYGRPTVYAGNREGDRLLLGFYFDAASGSYKTETVDKGAGPANVMLFSRDGHPALLAANRETDEIAVYDIFP